MSRGRVIETHRLNIGDFKTSKEGNVTTATINFEVFNSYVPMVTIVVSYVSDDGEVVADSKSLNVEFVLKNEV